MMPLNVNLRERFNALDAQTQENVINYFNCHNVAISIFNQLPQEAKDYISTYILVFNETNNDDDKEIKE